jgi:hypothetical protein
MLADVAGAIRVTGRDLTLRSGAIRPQMGTQVHLIRTGGPQEACRWYRRPLRGCLNAAGDCDVAVDGASTAPGLPDMAGRLIVDPRLTLGLASRGASGG